MRVTISPTTASRSWSRQASWSASRIAGGIEITSDPPDFETLTYSTILTYLTLTPGGVSRGYWMADERPNPLLGAVVGMVANREAAEAAKLHALLGVVTHLVEVRDELRKQSVLLEELVERGRK